MSFFVIAETTSLITSIGPESGLVAAAASVGTAAVIKLVDFFLKRRGSEKDAALEDISSIRAELIEEANHLRDNARRLVEESSSYREQYFEAREQLSKVRGERNQLEFERNRSRERYRLLKREVNEIIEYVQDTGIDEEDDHLQVRLDSLSVYFEDEDEFGSQ